MAFLRRGVATPPKEARDLTEVEQKGKQIFLSEGTQCAKCHVPDPDYTDREKYAFKRKNPPQGYDDEAKNEFKTPSLKFVAGTPPYFHDGSAATLEQLIEQNNDWMGKTNHLSKEEQAALVAFLKTL
jgi:cytochrome c peroxidase